MLSKIQYISQGSTIEEQIQNCTNVLEAGCKWIQIRFKNSTEEEFIKAAKTIQALCKNFNATFIINDKVEIAKDLNADGVHLGLTDTDIKSARQILGPAKIIGGTANTLAHVIQRMEEKCDYIGLGPFQFTATKEKLSPILGLEGYRQIMQDNQLVESTIPIYAIGGIEIKDIGEILNTGIYGVALSGILSNKNNTSEIISQLNKEIYANA